MTSYFDDRANEIREVACAGDYVLAMEIEDRVITDVQLVTGDREFPDDLRQRSNALIATLRIQCPSEESALVTALHDLFQDIALRHVQTRFGVLINNPHTILAARQGFDENSL